MTKLADCCTVFDLLALGKANAAERIAVQDNSLNLSYSDLFTYSQAFSSFLRERGIQVGNRIVIMVENSLEYVVALFGVFGAGAVAIPINPDTTLSFVEYVMRTSAATGIITRGTLFNRIHRAECKLPTVCMFETDFYRNTSMYFGGGQWRPCRMSPSSAVSRDDLAMILYTSGTTGQPKGVMLSHNNLLRNTCAIIQYLRLCKEDSTVTVLPFFYSFGNSVLLTHLAVCGRIVIENGFMYPDKVVQTMVAQRPSGLYGVPFTYYVLLNKSNFLQHDWSFLRYVGQAGGKMRTETIRQLIEGLRSTEIFIMYGQTEGTARLSFLQPGLLEKKIGSIGNGIAGVELRVVDDEGNTVAPGGVGEIIARGDSIMMGYLGNPEATSRVLRNGWLYTGDIARLDDEGFIYIIDRKSDFIKTASYRISPSEVEEVIAEIEGVIDVAVIGVDDELLGEALVACVRCPMECFDGDKIRSHCLSKLPLFKVPKYICHEPDIPVTASGKKCYNALRRKYARTVEPLEKVKRKNSKYGRVES